ncbi:MAG: 5-formyltetrahydrofolate cyclo-ligase [Anaerococcus sp.]|nr:5-formyltetrahydrofolate cyclo-ligase [Anaerococcus sp.]
MKSEFRRFFKNLRREMDEETLAEISEKIYKNLIESSLYQDARTIFTYLSTGKEVDSRKFIGKALDDGKKVYIPFIEKDQMKARRLKSFDDLVEGRFGIETTFNTEEIQNPDLSIIPGLAYDRDKNRLGLGGGFYDRFLARNKTIRLGVFPKDFKADTLDTYDHDQKMTYILTEEGIF